MMNLYDWNETRDDGEEDSDIILILSKDESKLKNYLYGIFKKEFLHWMKESIGDTLTCSRRHNESEECIVRNEWDIIGCNCIENAIKCFELEEIRYFTELIDFVRIKESLLVSHKNRVDNLHKFCDIGE